MEQSDTSGSWYTDRLRSRPEAAWKRIVPNPYRWNLRHLDLGRVLDVGCGVGRCLGFLDGRGVGVDHNPTSVAECRARGFEAFTPEEFAARGFPLFDTLLLSHVLEHLDAESGEELVRSYLPHVRPGGRVVLITPQEAGQRSDPTHVRFVDAEAARALLTRIGASVSTVRSFPFPRLVGRVFVHNETIASGTLSDADDSAD
jgi:2-polyprenyl-3-methyl-5-hydroxy-6-metoxy-1,4-benzoquinol methylase